MIVSVCADKGAPGVTTLATVLAMAWPSERVLLEADCSGADLPFRLRHADRDRLLDPQPSVLALAADARGALPTGGLLRYSQPCSLGVPVIPGALSAEAFGPMARLWPQVAAAAVGWSGTVIADLGRFQPGDPALPVVKASTVVLLLARADLEGLYHLRERVTEIAGTVADPTQDRSPVAVVVRARPGRDGKAAIGQVQQLLNACGSAVPVMGLFADDPDGAAGLRAGTMSRRLLGCELVRSGAALAETLLSWWPQLRTTCAISPATTLPIASPSTAAAAGRAVVSCDPQPDPQPDREPDVVSGLGPVSG